MLCYGKFGYCQKGKIIQFYHCEDVDLQLANFIISNKGLQKIAKEVNGSKNIKIYDQIWFIF